jgi:cobaltochelatase CobN
LAVLTTKRKVIAQVFVCQGCCCGQVERGRPEVPAEWLKEEWRRRGLLKRIQLTISGCLGPCDVPNVVAIVAQRKTVWLGNISRRDQYQSLLDWASRSKELGRSAELPTELLPHLLEDPISV